MLAHWNQKVLNGPDLQSLAYYWRVLGMKKVIGSVGVVILACSAAAVAANVIAEAKASGTFDRIRRGYRILVSDLGELFDWNEEGMH